MTTKTKQPKKAAKAAPAPEPTPDTDSTMPPEWQGPSRWQGKSLGYKLENSDVTDLDRLSEALAIDEPRGTAAIVEAHDRWLRDRLNDNERAQVAEFLRLVSWLDNFEGATAYRSQLSIPDCLLPIIREDVNTPEKLAFWWPDQIVDDAQPAADTPITDVEQAWENRSERLANAASSDAPAVEPTGQITLVEEPAKPSTIKPMTFRSAEEVGAVRRALEAELKELEKMAKDSEAMGEPAAAKIFRDKAVLLKSQLLPQVTAQQNLPFASKETLPGMIARTVAGEVRSRARAQLMKQMQIKKGETKDDAQARQLAKLDELEALIGNIAEQVGALATKFVAAAADRGIDAGKKALAAEPSQVAREAIQLVEFELQSGRAA